MHSIPVLWFNDDGVSTGYAIPPNMGDVILKIIMHNKMVFVCPCTAMHSCVLTVVCIPICNITGIEATISNAIALLMSLI